MTSKLPHVIVILMDSQTPIQKTEQVFLDTILKLIDDHILTPQESKPIIQEFLSCVDTNDIEKFKAQLQALTLKHQDFKPVYSAFLGFHEQEQVDGVLNKMNSLLQNSGSAPSAPLAQQ